MIDTLAETDAWQRAGALFARVMGQFVQTPFVHMSVGSCASADARSFVASVDLTQRWLSLSLSLVIEPVLMQRFAADLLGSADVDDAESLVLESGNILMGALRTSLAAEGVYLVLGIPAHVSFDRARRTLDGGQLRTHIRLMSARSSLELLLSAAAIDAAELNAVSRGPFF